jgi:transcription elongation factor Elf1
VKDVADQLAESAPRFARDALRALSSGDNIGFALFAATSIEHLLKSYLARKHPALIVDAAKIDSLLHACGQGAVARTPRDQIRTIGAAESLRRASRFLPALVPQADDLERLFGVRNGGVHVADSSSVDPFVLPFLKASEQVREALDLDRNGYWGEYVKLADQTIEEHVAAAALKAEASVAAAKDAFAVRFGDLEPAAQAAAITALEPTRYQGDEEQGVRCPACGSQALATGTVEAEWSYHTNADDVVPHLDATFLADTLDCRVCGLKLDNVDELAAAGVDYTWEIDVDPRHYYEEPEEDYYRELEEDYYRRR